jgi:DNA-directed RNA polymerase II subunit RPB1
MTNIILVTCPHCHLLVEIEQVNCAIFRHGINNDDIGAIAKASFEETPEMFLKAAKHGELDNMKGVSSNIMCGQEGYYGTSSFKVLVNNDVLMTFKPETDDENIVGEEELTHNALLKKLKEDSNDECNKNNLLIESSVTNIKPSAMGSSEDYELDF